MQSTGGSVRKAFQAPLNSITTTIVAHAQAYQQPASNRSLQIAQILAFFNDHRDD